MSAKEARDSFSDVLGRAYNAKETVIIGKQSRAFAVVLNPHYYDTLVRERDESRSAVSAGPPDQTVGTPA